MSQRVRRFKLLRSYAGLDYVEVKDGRECDVLITGERQDIGPADDKRLAEIVGYVSSGSWTELSDFAVEVKAELNRARSKHPGKQHSRHEGYGVLLEEVDEVKEAVWKNLPNDELRQELVQVAAMAQRMAEDLGL